MKMKELGLGDGVPPPPPKIGDDIFCSTKYGEKSSNLVHLTIGPIDTKSRTFFCYDNYPAKV